MKEIPLGNGLNARVDDGRRRTDDGRQKTEDGRQRTEDRGRKTEVVMFSPLVVFRPQFPLEP